MSFSVTNIGQSATGVSGTAHSITVPAGGVPQGAVIVITAVFSAAVTTGGAPPSDGLNTYNFIANNTYSGNANVKAWYAIATSALTSGSTITYTSTQSVLGMVDAIYVTGASTTAPLDSAATATLTGANGTPSLVSGTPANSGDLFIAFSGVSSSGSITRPGSWTATLPSSGSSSTITGSGSNLVGSGTATQTWAPTISASPNGNLIFALIAQAAAGAVARVPLLRTMGVGR